MKAITFWFDPSSPFAYLAFERLPEALEGCSYAVEYRPLLFAGLLFWWPIIMPGGPAWFVPMVRMGYLVASMVLMTAPNAMITFSDLPIYATFELAPPIPGISALQDQRFAGIWMRLGSAIAVWTTISILFYRWSRQETRLIDEEMDAVRKAGGSDAP